MFYLRDSLQKCRLPHFLSLFRHNNLHSSFFVLDMSSLLFELQSYVIQLRGHYGITAILIYNIIRFLYCISYNFIF